MVLGRLSSLGMRLRLALSCAVLLTGCAEPPSTGALWAQQTLERETALFRLTEIGRAGQARAYELGLADAELAAERARLASALQDCPGSTREPLTASSGDRIRDGIRARAAGDPARMAAVTQVALADWWFRRARSSGETSGCDRARDALTASANAGGAPAAQGAQANAATHVDLLADLGSPTVSRNPSYAVPAAGSAAPEALLGEYALGYVDAVRAAAPLPHYLSAVYGGALVPDGPPPDLAGQSPEAVVDELAPAHPEWEPDALYEALRPR